MAGNTFVIEKVDCDYYQIVLTAPTNGFWFQINEGDAPWVYGHRYELYDAAGNPLLPTGATQLPSFGTQQANCSTLAPRTSSARIFPAGTYYLNVRAPSSSFVGGSTMPNGVIPSGNYMLEIFTSRMDVNGTVAEVEPNNSLATATPLAPGQIGNGSLTISTGADASDWWGPIVITTPTTLFYQTRRAATGTPMLDTTINLRDSAGNIALASTTGNALDAPFTTASAHARGIVSFSFPGTYYLEVVAPGTAFGQSGDYQIQFGEAIAMPYVNASFATATVNAACGSAPFPTIARQFTSETPLLGALFSRQVTGCPASAPYFLMQGLSTTSANGGTVPLPYDLTPLGAPSCTINVDPAATTLGFADGTGVGEMQTRMPGNVALRGLYLYEQVIVLNPAANAMGVQVSNYSRLILGERSF